VFFQDVLQYITLASNTKRSQRRPKLPRSRVAMLLVLTVENLEVGAGLLPNGIMFTPRFVRIGQTHKQHNVFKKFLSF
jgi:hypothetical protein